MLELVVVKEMETLDELEQVRQLEQAIWSTSCTPIHQLVAFINNGGFVLGAYLNDELIGFNYSYAGFVSGEHYLYSHLFGVKREFRELGVGELLKLYQKEQARSYGHSKCKWIFDPLETRNGYLNFTKLRGYATTYEANVYGQLNDDFNKKLPSDRVFVEWQLEDDDALRWYAKIEELLEEAEELVPWSFSLVGLPMLDAQNIFDPALSYHRDAYLLPVPQYFQKIKVESPALAEDWRYKTRTIFETMFKQGYAIIHLVKGQGQEAVHFYLLVKKSLFAL
ncbi:GNAT family N-acetyltransferase [Solibacillus sp. CAU 1738]|uniref:GNAT family N-acetyltransferase n=1 Tax=Solibacillus sp. CAU 1738 TaxID=3140363 RepID=UPI0032610C65